MKYKWYVNNLNESNIIKDANESVLKLNSSDNIAAIEAIYCIVHNSIKYSNDKHEKESITVFYLNPLETSTSSAGLTSTTNSSLSHFSKIFFKFSILFLLYNVIFFIFFSRQFKSGNFNFMSFDFTFIS